MLIILSEIWSYKTENFKWRNSVPYQIGYNRQLVILSVVIISDVDCIFISDLNWSTANNVNETEHGNKK